MVRKAKKRAAKKKAAPRMRVLPRKMSALIGIACADLKKAEADTQKYTIDMSSWFSKDEAVCTLPSGREISRHPVCVMCAAGAVMGFTLGTVKSANVGDYLEPCDMDKNADQLCAINELREGSVSDAACTLGLSNNVQEKATKFDRGIPWYNMEDPKPFHKAMAKLQKDLAKAGL